MAAARALATLLALAAAGSALADEPRLKPVRIVSRVRQEAPDPGAGVEALGQSAAPLSFDYEPLDWWSDWFNPIKPEAGKKQKTTIHVSNHGDTAVPKGTILSIWANRTTPAKCGETGDVNYKLPELLPHQSKAIKASWKMPDTPGEAQVRVFLDSACTVFSGSADWVQQSLKTTVVEAGTNYAYLQLAPVTPASSQDSPSDPLYPVRNSTYKADISIINLGTAPSEEGVKMAVYYDFGKVPTNATTDCTYPGQISVDLPKINAGKIKVVVVEAPAPDAKFATLLMYLDATCTLGPAPVKTDGASHRTVAKRGAVMGGVQQKGEYQYIVKTTPKAPKANDTMTVKVKIINLGDADGSVGRIDVFTPTANQVSFFHFFVKRCNPTGFIHSFNTTDLVIKPGKSKMVKITDVPVPGTAGWWGLAAVPDAGCVNEAEKEVTNQPMPYITFEVVAP